jgi:hypothetical protein
MEEVKMFSREKWRCLDERNEDVQLGGMKMFNKGRMKTFRWGEK